MTHIMENIIYNELNIRQFSVDVGVVYARMLSEKGSSVRTPREIDFVVNSGGKRTYIQSAYAMLNDEKVEVELRPFTLIGDSFPKIVVRKDIGKRWYDDNGILNTLINIWLKDTNRLIEEYRNCTLNENSTIINNVYNYKLSEQEKRIIDFYRNGTNVQREYINKLIINE